jgi:tRNA 2-thiocytidine biosynthesis protein TtcA
MSTVLPRYSNTHSTTSYMGFAASNFLDESRSLIREWARASERDHVVLFTGRSSTEASSRLAHYLLGPAATGGVGTVGPCLFPGCGRVQNTEAEAALHARAHPDGESSLWKVAGGSGGDVSACGAPLPPATVLVGPYAHHSSFLPYTAAGACVSHLRPPTVQEARAGLGVSLSSLATALLGAARCGGRTIVVLTFASNITGDGWTEGGAARVSALVHAMGGVDVWDAAASAPHAAPVMDPHLRLGWAGVWGLGGGGVAEGTREACAEAAASQGGDTSWSAGKDALFFSLHKLVGGGAGAPGALIMRRELLGGLGRGGRDGAPFLPGGGTVFYVSPDGSPTYAGSDVEREEGGSPDTVSAARAGLAVRLLSSVGGGMVREREDAMVAAVLAVWTAHPRIHVFGHGQGGRLPILSFAISAPETGSMGTRASGPGLLLHWALVAAMLNDFFGIQARGGCLCAGPYAQSLLGMDVGDESRLLGCLLARDELLRPGFVRVSLAYHMAAHEVAFIARAVAWIADHGAALLAAGLYAVDGEKGEWRMHRARACGALAAGYKGRGGLGGESPRAVIARYTPEREQEESDAGKGGPRAHSRSWLASVRFGAGGEGEGVAPLLPVLARTSKEHAALLQAYLDEAVVVLEGVRAGAGKGRGGEAMASGMTAAGLLSAEGQARRWFVLPEDLEVRGGEVCLTYDGASHPGPATMFPLPFVLLHAKEEGECEPTEPTVFLRALCEGRTQLSPALRAAVQAWDGEEEEEGGRGGSGATVIPCAPVPVEVTRVSTVTDAAGIVRVQSLPPAKGSKPRASLPPVSAPLAVAEGSAVVATPCTPALPLPPPLTPLEYVWRRARLAATTAQLGIVPRPLPSVSRAIASGLKRAILQYGMIKSGDRVLVGLSGGKDSMCLLLELLRLQALAPVWFEVGAATVDPQYEGAYDPAPLQAWCASLGVEYTIEAAPVLALASSKMENDSLCAFCSRLKRGILYGACRRRGFNVLALGQHLDDFAESFIMSSFQNGLLRTMKAHYANEARDVRIIRPLVYVRERDTRAFAHAARLPVIPENCPGCFTAPTARYAVKKLLAREEARNPTLFACLAQAMQPLMCSAGAAAVWASAATTVGGGGGANDVEDEGAAGVGGLLMTVEEEVAGVAPEGFVPALLAAPEGAVARHGDEGAGPTADEDAPPPFAGDDF